MWSEKSYPWVLFTFFLSVYLLYPTNLPYIDGLYYSYHVEHMPLSNTFHPHHLLFLTITQIIYSVAHYFLDALRGLQFYQSLNSLLAAVTLVYIYKLLTGLFKKPTAAFLGTFFYGSTFGFWHHATDANIYITFNLLLTILLTRYLLDKDPLKKSRIISTALLLAFATMFHQLAFFLLLPFGALYLRKTSDSRSGIKAAGLFFGVYSILVAIPYLLAFTQVVQSDEMTISNFAKWVTAYGSNRNFWPILYHDVYYCVGIVARSQFESLYHIIPSQIIIFRGLDTGESESLINLFSFVMALILMLMIERIHFINFRATEEEKVLYRKVFLWMVPFFIFFGFFAPENYFYRIFYLAPLIIFAGGLLQSSTLHDKKNIKPFLFVFVIFTFLYNGYDGIIPESKVKNNPFVVSAGKIHNATSEEDLVIFADKERYLAACYRYYFDREALHALSRLRYKEENPGDIENAKYETVKFLSNKYPSIYLTSTAREMGVNVYYFSLNNVIPPHPAIMLLEKDQLTQQDYLDYQSGVLFKVMLSDPSREVVSDDVLMQINETIDKLKPIR